MKAMLKIALVGRTNVGKSTLFNKLLQKNISIVDRTPGVTRDYKQAYAKLNDISFLLTDTAGFEDYKKDVIHAQMWEKTSQIIDESSIVVLVLDYQDEINPADKEIAKILHRKGKKVIVCFNKTEGQHYVDKGFELGFKHIVNISAIHKTGFYDLYEAMKACVPNYREYNKAQKDDKEADLTLAIVGRPNAGKSSLINQIIKEDRLITSNIAGTTRDSISLKFKYKDNFIRIVDTAGIHRKTGKLEFVEKLSLRETKRAINFANVVVLLVDAEEGLHKHDLTIARKTIEEGRALIIAVNKVDILEDKIAYLDEIKHRLSLSLSQLKGVSIIGVSALQKTNIYKLLDLSVKVFAAWNVKIPTSLLNNWLTSAVANHEPPIVSGIRFKIKYISQIKNRPPTFALYVNKKVDFPPSYMRYLTKSLLDGFGLYGTNIRIVLKTSQNPYVKG